MSQRLLRTIAIVLVIGVAPPARAQSANPWAVDVTMGVAGPISGGSRMPAGPALDVIAGKAIATSRAQTAVRWAGALSVQSDFISDTPTCRAHCVAFPMVMSGMALIGREWLETRSRRNWSLRSYAGPGLFMIRTVNTYPAPVATRLPNGTIVNPTTWETEFWRTMLTGGVAFRLDLAIGQSSRVQMVSSLRVAMVPAMPLDTRGTHSFSLGLRFR